MSIIHTATFKEEAQVLSSFLLAGAGHGDAGDDEHQYIRNLSLQHRGVPKLATAASMQTVM